MKKTDWGVLLLLLFHGINNFFFVRDNTNFLFIIMPHYYVNFHLKVLLNIVSYEMNDIMLSVAWMLDKLGMSSFLALKLTPTMAFLLLILIIYLLVNFLFPNKKIGFLAAVFVSFAPGNIFYSRIYEHHIYLIMLVYLSVYLITRFVLSGCKVSLVLAIPVLYVGANMIENDASFEFVFLVYVGSFLAFIFREVIKEKKFLLRYFLIVVVFILNSLTEIIPLFFSVSRRSYYLQEGFKKFIYPDTYEGWMYYFSFYAGELLNSLFIWPFIIFIFLYGYLLRVPKNKKTFYGVNSVNFLNALFFPWCLFTLINKKQIFYISPLISLIAIIAAVGIMMVKNKLKRRSLIIILVVLNLVYFFSFSCNYLISGLSGERFLENYNNGLPDYISDSCAAQPYSLSYAKVDKEYYSIKLDSYQKLDKAKFKLNELAKQVQVTREVGQEDKKELAVLEYILDQKQESTY